jgi:hypothetical protein
MKVENQATCETWSAIQFSNSKNVRPGEIDRQIVEVYYESARNKGNMRKWCRLFQEGTTMHDCMPPSVHAHYSNSSSGKFSGIPHTVLILHQVIITHFSTSRNFWPARVFRVTKRQKDIVQDWLKDLAVTFSDKGIQKPVPPYDKCVNLHGNYGEK